MKSLIVGDKPTVQRLAERLKRAVSQSEYERIQCVLIRATLGSSAAEIAQLLDWSTATVHVMHSRWAKEGETIFDVGGRGGRHHQHLTQEQEQEKDLLAPFVECSEAGGMLTVADIFERNSVSASLSNRERGATQQYTAVRAHAAVVVRRALALTRRLGVREIAATRPTWVGLGPALARW